jgi:hypothetical protein
LARRSLLYATHQDLAAEIWMIPVVDFQLLPDMGERAIALGGKAWLFAGSDRGVERAAIMVTLIMTARLNNIDPKAWLADLVARYAFARQLAVEGMNLILVDVLADELGLRANELRTDFGIET